MVQTFSSVDYLKIDVPNTKRKYFTRRVNMIKEDKVLTIERALSQLEMVIGQQNSKIVSLDRRLRYLQQSDSAESEATQACAVSKNYVERIIFCIAELVRLNARVDQISEGLQIEEEEENNMKDRSPNMGDLSYPG